MVQQGFHQALQGDEVNLLTRVRPKAPIRFLFSFSLFGGRFSLTLKSFPTRAREVDFTSLGMSVLREDGIDMDQIDGVVQHEFPHDMDQMDGYTTRPKLKVEDADFRGSDGFTV